jgi:hypothetical protein
MAFDDLDLSVIKNSLKELSTKLGQLRVLL